MWASSGCISRPVMAWENTAGAAFSRQDMQTPLGFLKIANHKPLDLTLIPVVSQIWGNGGSPKPAGFNTERIRGCPHFRKTLYMVQEVLTHGHSS